MDSAKPQRTYRLSEKHVGMGPGSFRHFLGPLRCSSTNERSRFGAKKLSKVDNVIILLCRQAQGLARRSCVNQGTRVETYLLSIARHCDDVTINYLNLYYRIDQIGSLEMAASPAPYSQNTPWANYERGERRHIE